MPARGLPGFAREERAAVEIWLFNARRPNGELKAKEHGLKNTHHAFV